MIAASKTCTGCGDTKPLDEFHRNPNTRDGRLGRCRSCVALYDREHYARNRERIRRQEAERYAADPARQKRAIARSWHWREDNRERANAYWREYRRQHREASRDYKARKRAAHVEDVVMEAVWLRDRGVCHICGVQADPDDWHMDHVIPLAKGGTHEYANVAVSHPRCNLVKGQRFPPSASLG